MSLIRITEGFASIVGADSKEFFAQIKEQNKQKAWSITPVKIDFKNGMPITNAPQIQSMVDMVSSWATESKTHMTMNELDAGVETIKTIYDWFSGSRKVVTGVFDNAKKEFIAQEHILKNTIDELKQEIETRKEKEYQKTENVLKIYIESRLNALAEEDDIKLQDSIFDDFMAKKRKNKGTLTQKGELTSAVIKDFDTLLNSIIEPIIKERETEKRKQEALNRAEYDCKEFAIYSSDDIESMQRSKVGFEKLMNDADVIYDEFKDDVKRLIQTKITLLDKNIEHYQKLEEANQDKVSDEELLKTLSNNDESIDGLDAFLIKLRNAYPYAKLTATKDKITEIANEVKAKKEKLLAEQVQEVIEAPIKEIKEVQKKKFFIDMFDLEVLATSGVEAESVEGAKVQFLDKFKVILENAEIMEEK